MSGRSAARTKKRREKRVMRAAGVAAMHRTVIENGAIEAAVMKGASLPDFLSLHVSTALDALAGQGADMLGRIVVTMGQHPDYPNAITVEAKAATLHPNFVPPTQPADDDERDDAGS